jgi:hypothetical protein
MLTPILAAALALLPSVPPGPAPHALPDPPLRAPAVPLAVGNPYFSAWSRADRLTDDWARHWTGAVNGMVGMVRVDGRAYRWCGPYPQAVPAATQVALRWSATSTQYVFDAGGVRLTVTFTSPVLAQDPDLASRGVTFVTADAASSDGAAHDVSLYLDVTGEWCTHEPSQAVAWSRARVPGLEVLRMGTTTQGACERAGDHTRIDWGYITLAAPRDEGTQAAMAGHETSRDAFAASGRLPEADDLRMPRPARDDWPVLAVASNVTAGAHGAPARAQWMIALDEGYSVEYFGRKLRPYWARGGENFADMLARTWADRGEILERCHQADQDLRRRLAPVVPPRFASLCELVYRQVMGAHCIAADFDGTMLMFSKENTSNGCIATVDVLFPAAPFLLAMNPDLLEASLRPVYAYAASPRWKFDFAPHDLGTYPKANGQVYGGGERTDENQMPVEECGNMLILTAALARARPGWQPPREWWGVMEKWAAYLGEHGLDPANQLCTDDFAGHLARNANLGVKAVVGVGAAAHLRARAGGTPGQVLAAAEMARQWHDLARAEGRTVLAYGRPDTWSIKYNMFWDRYLGLGLFPPETSRREIAWYLTKGNEFGVPMDSRVDYTKPEWIVWAACLAESREDFDRLVGPIADLADKTTDRVPFTDWYTTTTGRTRGMHSRSVVGGLYAPLLVKAGE